MNYDPNMPVMVTWYTYEWIPRRLHAIIVSFKTADNWARQGADIQIEVVDRSMWRDMAGKTRQ